MNLTEAKKYKNQPWFCRYTLVNSVLGSLDYSVLATTGLLTTDPEALVKLAATTPGICECCHGTFEPLNTDLHCGTCVVWNAELSETLPESSL